MPSQNGNGGRGALGITRSNRAPLLSIVSVHQHLVCREMSHPITAIFATLKATPDRKAGA
jgi:hypothetical protein